MITTLYRGRGPLAWLVCWLLLLGLSQSAQASHLLGGEMTYRYLDATGPAAAPLRYELTVAIYNSCSSAVLNDFATVGIYDQATGTKLALTTVNFPTINDGSLDIPQTSLDACVTPVIPPGCTILGNSQAFRLQKFVGIVNLPATTQGFYAYWTAYARNLDITNLFDPGNQYMSLYCTLAPPALANHSPVFVNKAVANLCANDTTYILNNAVDADGDQLVYSLGQPYGSDIPASFSGLPALLSYNGGAGYAPPTPLGTASGNYSSINAATGIAKFRTTAALNNKFVVAIDVREYRTINGQQVLIGITRRDVQLVVVTCPVTARPVLPTNAPVNPVPRTYTVEAGSTLTIPLPATQANGHPLTMTLSSVLLDGAGGHDATFAGNAGTLLAGSPVGTAATSSAASPVTGTFVYKPACTDVRPTPYDISLMVEDNGCAGQTVGDVLRITVVMPTGPSGITGNAAVCGPNTPQSYTATGGTAPNVSWTATGGTIVGSPTANPVQVQWPAAGTYTLVAQGVTQYGCPTGQVTKTVVVSPLPTLTIAGNQTICQGSTTTLTVTGGTAPYALTGGATPVSGAGPFVLSPAQTTTYTVTDASGTCVATRQVTITVNAKPVANAGSAVGMCAGATAQLGAAAVTGNTYSWSPATGLSNTNIANPTVTLANATASPLIQTYTLTVTNAVGCTSTSTVAVTVNPLPVAAPGAAVAICSGGTGQLGSAPVVGYTYSWSPSTGLSSTTVANPTMTLTNSTGTASTQTYTLTVTSAAGCTSTGTVAVTVNPLPVANAGAAVASCAGSSAQVGAAPVAGLIYSWSPATGLSNASIANPTVTLSNATASPLTQTYTLTVTNAAGCTSTSTVAVTVNPLPVAAPGAAVAICSGGTGQLGSAPVAGTAYQWSPATGLSSSTVANPTITLTTTGAASTQTYTLTATSAAGCTSTGTVNVTVNPLPVANAGAAVAICAGSSAQVGAAPVAGLTYSWSPTAGLSNASIANPTVTLPNATTSPLTQTYTLTVTNAAGCTSTSTIAVTVNPLPVAVPGAAVAICSGVTGQLGSAPVAGYTYQWSPTTGLSNASLANPIVSLTNATGAATTQTYTLTVTNTATGCTSTGTVAVTVNPLPVAVPGVAIAICSGSTGQLGASPVAGYTYNWSPATGLNSATAANPTVTLTNSTGTASTQLYTLTVTSAAGCTSTGTVAITVNPLPIANAGAAVAFCSGGSAQLGSAAVPGYTYSWSPTTGLNNPAAATPTVTLTNAASAATTQTYTLTVTNSATGCVNTAAVTVTVQPLPVATAGAAVAFCAGGTGQLGTAPVAGLAYSWSPATGLSSAASANPTVTLPNTTTGPLTQTYTLTVTNASNCVSTSTVAVTVLPLPVAAPGAAITICAGSVGQLGASPVAGFSYSWSPATGLSNPASANPTVTLPNTTGAATTQTYTLTVTSASGCLSTGTVAVTVNPAVVPGAIGTSQTICAASVPAPLTSVAPASGGTGTYTYQWEASTDNATWQAITNATGLSYAPGALTRTAHFRRRAIGTCGAALTNAVTIQVQPLLVPSVALPTLPAQCAGTAFTFAPVPTNAGTAPTYQWLVNGVAVGTGSVFTSSALADGDQVQVVLTPTAGFCASGTATATAHVSLTPTPAPTLTIVAQTAMPVCAGVPIRFSLGQATALGANPQYQWQVDGVNVAGATSSVFTSTALRNGQAVTLVLRTTNACGQPATATSGAVRVVLNPSVHLSAGPNKTIMEGESVELEGSADGSYPVVWSPAATLAIGSNPLRPKASPTATTTYTLAAGAGYCADPSPVTVTVTRRIRIPNAFTPNADNNDDTWQIEGIEDYPANHVLIVNRWGGKIFEASGYSRANEWKGTINGEPAPIGTYYYVLTLGNGKSYTGPLTIVN